MTELKPCPKCGGSNIHLDQFSQNDDRYVMGCDDCDYMTATYKTPKQATVAWNTRTPPEPATDAELVAICRKLPLHGDAGCDKLTDDEWRTVIAAIAPAIRAQERAKIVAWLRAGALYRDWKRASLRLRIKAAWLSFRRPWTFAKSACETQLATAIEQGTHDNETE